MPPDRVTELKEIVLRIEDRLIEDISEIKDDFRAWKKESDDRIKDLEDLELQRKGMLRAGIAAFTFLGSIAGAAGAYIKDLWT